MEQKVLSKFIKTLESEGKLNCKYLKVEENFREKLNGILNNPNIPIEQKINF